MATTQKTSTKKGSSKKPAAAPVVEAALVDLTRPENTGRRATDHQQAGDQHANDLLVADAQAAATAAMQFAVQQLTTPAVAGLQALVAQATKLAAPKAAKAARVMCAEQNGQKRPLANGGLCDKLWSTADAITAMQKSPCTIAQLTAAMPGVNMHTVKTQYASWRKFNGVTGRLPTAPKEPARKQVVADWEGNP